MWRASRVGAKAEREVGPQGVSLSQIKAVNVEIAVVLGRSTLPMQQLLRMGRGAVIPLDAKVADEVWILANNHPAGARRNPDQRREDLDRRDPRGQRLRLHGRRDLTHRDWAARFGPSMHSRRR